MHFYVGPTCQWLPCFVSHVTYSMMSLRTDLIHNTVVYHTKGLSTGNELLCFYELKMKRWTLFEVFSRNLYPSETEPKWHRKKFTILIGLKYIFNYQSYKISSDIKTPLISSNGPLVMDKKYYSRFVRLVTVNFLKTVNVVKKWPHFHK